jgi:hypothetical protein
MKVAFKVSDDVEMKRLVDGLAHDIIDAHIHYKMHNDLIEALKANPVALRESNTFWNLTISAHIRLSQTALTRAYDQEHQTLHLRSWLTLIDKNPEMFSEASFRKRMKDNPHVDSLARTYCPPDPEQLATDIALCSSTDPLVRILICHRNNEGSHRSGKLTVEGKRINDSYPLTYDDFETLLNRALEILHRYSVLFAATSYSVNVIGRHDFQAIIRAMNEQDDRRNADIKAAHDNLVK